MDDIVCLTEFGKDFAFVVCRLDAVRNSFDIIRAFFAVVGFKKSGVFLWLLPIDWLAATA